MILGAFLAVSVMAGQSAAPVPTAVSPTEPPEPEIVTLATTPTPAPSISKPLAAAPPVKAAPVPTPIAAPMASPVAAPAASTGRIPVLRTPDRAGKAPVYAIHFSSFQKRENSARDAAALAKRLKLPAYAVRVELGAKGTWYRTMVGEFATAEDARRVLEALPQDLAREAGGLYRLQAP